jgi:DNA-binding response OmpR family regulator
MAAERASGRRINVLVIDSEPSVSDSLGIILKDEGYTVAVAGSGRRGLEQAVSQHFDVTLVELHLPDLSGLDIFQTIREKDPDSLVIILSSRGTPEVIAELKGLGAADVLLKPFTPSDLLKSVAASLAKRGLLNAYLASATLLLHMLEAVRVR